MHCFLQLSADLHSSAHSEGEASDFLLLAGCAWTSARVSAESEPRGSHGPALAASRPAETSTDLRGGEGCQGHLASPQRLQLLAGCVVCTPLCRSAASAWPPLRNPAAKPAPNRRPLWLSLHSAAARYARLRSVPRQPNPQRKEHQENSRSSLPFSFSPRSLIESTTVVSEMLARRAPALDPRVQQSWTWRFHDLEAASA